MLQFFLILHNGRIKAERNHCSGKRIIIMGLMDDWMEESTYSRASGKNYHYVVLQVILKEKFFWNRFWKSYRTGKGN